MFTVPDEHMPYIIQLHIVSIQPANKAAHKAADQFIIMTSIGKENRSSQCLSRTVREREKKRKKKKEGGGGGTVTSSRKDCVELYGLRGREI